MTQAHNEALRQLAAHRNLREEEVVEQLIERAYERPDAFLDWSPGGSGQGADANPFAPDDEEMAVPAEIPA